LDPFEVDVAVAEDEAAAGAEFNDTTTVAVSSTTAESDCD